MTVADRTVASRRGLWFGFVGGPVAWLAHLLLVYTIGEFGCLTWPADRIWLGLTPVAWMVIAATVITGIPAGAATVIAYRATNQFGADASETATEPGRHMLAYAGLAASGISTLTILVEALPVLYYLRDC